MARRRKRSARGRVRLPRGITLHGTTYRAEVMIGGTRLRKGGFADVLEATQWLETARAEFERTVDDVDWKPGQGAFRVIDAIELKRRQLARLGRSDETLRFYEPRFDRLLAYFEPTTPLATIRKADIERVIREERDRPIGGSKAENAKPSERRQSNRSIQATIATLRSIFNVARKAGRYVGENPVSFVELPRVRSRRFDHLSEDELRTALTRGRAAAAEEGTTWVSGAWDCDVFEFLALSGLRRRGLARLRAADCDPAKGVLCVVEKDGEREVPLSKRASEVLSRLIEHAKVEKSEWLVPADKELKRAVLVTRAASRFKTHAGLDVHGAAHVARHSFGTGIANLDGAMTWDVQHALGDRTLSAASRYVHETGSRRRSMVEQFARRMADQVVAPAAATTDQHVETQARLEGV